MKLSTKKTIAITLGDPGGIGPEVVAKALAKPSLRRLAHFQIIGDEAPYRRYFSSQFKNCSFVDCKSLSVKSWKIGRPTRVGARASLDYLNKAIELLKNKTVSALVTAPVCKESICVLDSGFQGHTEFLAQAFHTPHVGMMFVSQGLRTILVTRHIPLNQVSKAVTSSKVYETIALTDHALRSYFGIQKPVVAVCGLNPHAGEGGTIGKEEITHIIPAIKKAHKNKMRVEGPFAADTLFSPEAGCSYDAIVAMYHDQGLIGVKTQAFTKLVNLTIGLPFVRTSPAHGTAFNIAGTEKADSSSMCEAIKLAVELSAS